MSRLFTKLFRTPTAKTLFRKNSHRPSFDALEDRQLMAATLTAGLSGGILQIEGTEKADTIVVRVSNTGNISVDGVNIVRSATSSIPSGQVVKPGASVPKTDVTKIVIKGLGGNDSIQNLTSVTSEITGGRGNDVIVGGAGKDIIKGEADNDTLEGRAGDDDLQGGAGDDVYVFSGFDLGSDTITDAAKSGVDTLDYNGFNNTVIVDLAVTARQNISTASTQLTLPSGTEMENVNGSYWNDTLRGNGLANRLSGYEGNDILEGQSGADTIEGQGGNDTLKGGTGSDTYVYSSNSDLHRTAWGEDTITEAANSGSDWLDFSGFGAGVDVELTSADFGIDDGNYATFVTLTNRGEVENVRGSAYGDSLRGDDRANTLEGNGGADLLFGRGGNDTLNGGTQNDALFGEAGDDTLLGDAGSDHLDGGPDKDTLKGGANADNLFGDLGNDTLLGEAGNDTLIGGPGNDTLTDTGTNTLTQGNDIWYDDNLEDAAVRALVRYHHRDLELSRPELLEIFAQVGRATGTTDNVSGAEYRDLIDLVNRSEFIKMPHHVRKLAAKTVISDPANDHFQGEELGNLSAGASGSRLGKLVDKWFLGKDLPESVYDYEHFSGELFQDGIAFTDIDQNGGTGTCYLLSTLIEVAFHQPSLIEEMFIDNQDGTFTVRIFHPDGTPDYVTVDRRLPASSGTPTNAAVGFTADGTRRTAGDASNELWVALAEKAYAQANESGWIDRLFPQDKGQNSYDAVWFGNGEHAIENITGRDGHLETMAFYPGDDLDGWPISTVGSQAIRDRFDEGKVVTLSVGPSDPPRADDLEVKHVYAMAGYEFDASNLAYKFTIVDPADVSNPIIFSSWNELKDNFLFWFWG